jgi:histidine phosphotransferase ChpT
MSGTHGALCLIERVSEHLCHATEGPVGLLSRALSDRDRPGAATADVAQALVNRLRLWLAAWGPAGHSLSLTQVAALARGLPDHVTVDLSALPPATVFPAGTGRVVLNLLLLAAEALPEGGRVVLAGSAEDLFLQIAGPTAVWPAGTALCVTNPGEAQSALTDGRNLQMALTASLAHATGIRLSALFAPATKTEPAILRLGG